MGKGEAPPPEAGNPQSPFSKEGREDEWGRNGAVARPTEKKEQGGNKSRPYVQAIRLNAESWQLKAT
jgi:hypothetical protein